MPTIASENLLKAILELGEDGEEVIAARLADFLRISPAAVSMALKRLQSRGDIRFTSRKTIQLTTKGLEQACALVRKHRLVERLLVDVLKMPWEKVHETAEKLEHAITPELEARLLEMFGENGTCPHGSPFTPSLPLGKRRGEVALTDAPVNQPLKVVRIAELHEHEENFLESLAELELKPGTRVRVARKTFDGVLEIKTAGRDISLSQATGSRIWVQAATQ
jgi:DtxR family transcriptional regulator, Mn-dependent transcriptional regulator